MLGDTQEVRECPKRAPVPRLTAAEVSSEDETETSTQKRKKVANKIKKNQAAVKRDSYEAILHSQLSQAHEKNANTVRVTRKRQPASTSMSSSDDSLVSSNELQEAREKAKFWKSRSKELQEGNKFLQEQVRAQRVLLGSKIFRLEDLQSRSQDPAVDHGTMETEGLAEPCQAVKLCQSSASRAAPRARRKLVESHPGLLGPHPQEMKSNQGVVPHIPRSSSAMAGLAAQVPHVRVPAAASPGACLEEFSYMPDGSLHLQKGITLTPVQATRVMKLKKKRHWW
ncbi:unnamed protein product [Ixodes pacificus]